MTGMRENRYSNILTHRTDDCLTIIINRPEKRNALNQSLIEELIHVFQKNEHNPGLRSVILRGNGNAFCSGADIEYMNLLKDSGYELNVRDSLRLAELYLSIYNYSLPVIACVTGPAIGGGCGLASVCDFIVATPASRFGYPEVKIGFVAAMVSVFLIRQIGERRARELLLTGKILSADDAKSIGLITDVVEEGALETNIQNLTEIIKSNSPEALKTTKKILSDFSFTNLLEEINRMALLNAEVRGTKDFIEGISAFIEKRKPNWV